jgi:hypothetical protein
MVKRSKAIKLGIFKVILKELPDFCASVGIPIVNFTRIQKWSHAYLNNDSAYARINKYTRPVVDELNALKINTPGLSGNNRSG